MSLIDGIFYKLIVEEFKPPLNSLGFNFMKKRKFRKKNGKCTLELSFDLRKIRGMEAGYISVYAAIIYDDLCNIVAELKNEKKKIGWPTTAANIGNLRKKAEFVEWPITVTTDMISIGKIINNEIKEYVIPFWDSFGDIRGLIKGYELEDPRLTLIGNEYKWNLIAAYCLEGDIERAKSILEKMKDKRTSDLTIENAKKIIFEKFS